MMIHKKSPFDFSPLSAFRSYEMLLVVSLFALGGWMLHGGWGKSNYVGWLPGGALLVIGSIACTWLIWQRRGTQRSILLPIIFVLNSSSLVEDILKWQMKEENASWPMARSIFAVLFLTQMIVEEVNYRKEAAKDATRESKLFDQEDTL